MQTAAMKTEQNPRCIDECNQLLRGEAAAVEVYEKAIDKFGDHPAVEVLAQLRQRHEQSADELSRVVASLGGEPSDDSGAWGIFARSLQSAADLFGKESAIESLERAENHHRHQLERSMENESLVPECKALIGEFLLPRVRDNLRILGNIDDRLT